jgi:membrane fusion protein (multidrug efflux system)
MVTRSPASSSLSSSAAFRAVRAALVAIAPVLAVAALAPLALGGCDRTPDVKPAPAQGPVEVGVVTLEAKDLTLTTELPGRTSPFRIAEVRARVDGIVQKRLFTEGADVEEGQPLFQLESAPYQAAYARAKAQLTRAEATVTNARVRAQRAQQMFAEGVGSEAERDDAQAALLAAEADVTASTALLRAAAIDLGFTKVDAPLAGRIGRAEVTEGALAQRATATLLATIQQLDPLYVDLTWSSAEALRLRRDVESGKVKTTGGKAEVEVVLEDGRLHPHKGELQFADVSVDPSTGSISLRAIVPNPGKHLLPGMFVRARIAEGVRPAAILVPQRGVTRDARGVPTALVVNEAGKVERRELVTEREVGPDWLVSKGVVAGDRVIVEGLQRVRPGVEVKAVPAAPLPSQTVTPPTQEATPPAGSATPAAGGSADAKPSR